MSTNFPCKDCSHRTIGCHAVCAQYKRSVQERQAYNERVRHERILDTLNRQLIWRSMKGFEPLYQKEEE